MLHLSTRCFVVTYYSFLFGFMSPMKIRNQSLRHSLTQTREEKETRENFKFAIESHNLINSSIRREIVLKFFFV